MQNKTHGFFVGLAAGLLSLTGCALWQSLTMKNVSVGDNTTIQNIYYGKSKFTDSVSVKFPKPVSIKAAATVIANQDGCGIDFVGCHGIETNLLEAGLYSAKTGKALIVSFSHRLINTTNKITYSVDRDSERGIYYVRCN